MTTKLNFDVRVHWHHTEPVYRLYVDNDLITERTWIWPNNTIYLNEELMVNLDPEKEHCLQIEVLPCNFNPQFEIRNFSVNDQITEHRPQLEHKFYIK